MPKNVKCSSQGQGLDLRGQGHNNLALRPSPGLADFTTGWVTSNESSCDNYVSTEFNANYHLGIKQTTRHSAEWNYCSTMVNFSMQRQGLLCKIVKALASLPLAVYKDVKYHETSCAARSPPQYAHAPPWLLTFWLWSRCGSRKVSSS